MPNLDHDTPQAKAVAALLDATAGWVAEALQLIDCAPDADARHWIRHQLQTMRDVMTVALAPEAGAADRAADRYLAGFERDRAAVTPPEPRTRPRQAPHAVAQPL